jgi:hypothetical protein
MARPLVVLTVAALAAALLSGAVAVAPVGDADCGGHVTSIDAAIVLQYSASLVHALPCPTEADANQDGSVTAVDATLILQFSAGLISHLGPGVGATATPAGAACGVERWAVKTLSDADANSVNFTPVTSSVGQLRALPRPGSLPPNSRIAPTELTVFSVTAQLVEFKLEDDRDIHLVIADQNDSSLTMIVEFPDATTCSGAVSSAHAQAMRSARAALVAAEGSPSASHFTSLSGTVTVTGVGFFDFLHGQTGVAPNGIELHPVLSFSLQGGGPQPTVAPTPTSLPGPATYPCEATDCNCSDFPTHAEAQRVFLLHGGSPTNNWSALDGDHDGIACENLP